MDEDTSKINDSSESLNNSEEDHSNQIVNTDPENLSFNSPINNLKISEEYLKSMNIIMLHNSNVKYSVDTLFKSLWVEENGYSSFLVSQGDLDVKFAEWVPFPDKVVSEDKCKFSFQYFRSGTYAHPRTSMLMFG